MNRSTIQNLFSKKETPETYIIAEIGINHDGQLAKAKDLMRIAAETGVNAVKFQKRNLAEIYVPPLLKDTNSAEWSFQYLLPQLKTLELSDQNYLELNEYAKHLNIDLIVTPFDLSSAEFIKKLDLAAVKMASADLTNWPLIKKVSEMKLPIILSTGMWPDAEVKKTSDYLKTLSVSFAFLHCQSTYPAPLESINLQYLETLKKYAPVVGYSGHERGISICLGAMGQGAKIIEKHITFDHSESGPDHKASLEPAEFRTLVQEIRKLDKALGKNEKLITQAEILNKEVFAKSLTLNKDISAGHLLKKEDVVFLSPGKGISPCDLDLWIGKKIMKDKKQYDYLSENDFVESKSISEWEKFSFSKDWGIKCRFHDFKEYSVLNPQVIEFHCSDKDMTGSFNEGNKNSELIIHAPEIIDKELVDLCSHNEDITARSVQILNQTITKTLELSPKYKNARKPKIVLHVGGMLLDSEHADTVSMMKKAEKQLSRLDLSKVDLLPENLPPRPWYLGGQWYQHAFMHPKEIKEFCQGLGLGMTLDICHAQLYCDYFKEDLLEFIKTVMPCVRHLHISDAAGFDGEGVQIGEGDINFDQVFKLLEKTNYSWVPEIWSGHLHQGHGCHVALQKLKKYNGLI